jgi:hypothetical protein
VLQAARTCEGGHWEEPTGTTLAEALVVGDQEGTQGKVRLEEEEVHLPRQVED